MKGFDDSGLTLAGLGGTCAKGLLLPTGGKGISSAVFGANDGVDVDDTNVDEVEANGDAA
jgi:hypothetical protein